jgi:cytochrome b561
MRLSAVAYARARILRRFGLAAMRLFHQILYVLFLLFVLLGFFYAYEVIQTMLRIQTFQEHEIEVIRQYEPMPERIEV